MPAFPEVIGLPPLSFPCVDPPSSPLGPIRFPGPVMGFLEPPVASEEGLPVPPSVRGFKPLIGSAALASVAGLPSFCPEGIVAVGVCSVFEAVPTGASVDAGGFVG
jgi:hypothetical protein